MINIMKILIAFMSFIYGITLICDWTDNLHSFLEGDTIEEISLDKIYFDDYVSFYIEDYADKDIYVDGNDEYEVYTILIEHDTSSNINSYIQVMVINQDTKQKLNNPNSGKVYFQGQVVEVPCGGFDFNEDWNTGVPEGMDINYDKLVGDMVIMEKEVPDKGYGVYVGIVLIVLSIIVYRMSGGIQSCVPDVEIKSDKYKEYNSKYFIQTHNIKNEWMCEKENLKNLKAEQIANRKVSNIMTVIFIVGLYLVLGDARYFRGTIISVIVLILRMVGCIFMYIGIGGVWSKFINSSHKLSVYIATRRRKRSIYVEIEKCKINIQELERIMEETL
jgi:hypothetical protein